MGQWVLRSTDSRQRGEYFIVFDFKTLSVKRVMGIRFATVLTEDMKMFQGYGKTIMNLAKKAGFPGLEWKLVDILMVYPISREPGLSLIEGAGESNKLTDSNKVDMMLPLRGKLISSEDVFKSATVNLEEDEPVLKLTVLKNRQPDSGVIRGEEEV